MKSQHPITRPHYPKIKSTIDKIILIFSSAFRGISVLVLNSITDSDDADYANYADCPLVLLLYTL